MIHRRALAMLASLLLTVALLVGCAPASAPGAPAPATPSPPATAAPPRALPSPASPAPAAAPLPTPAAAPTPGVVPPPSATAPSAIPTEPNLTVAFIGDTANGRDFARVLDLIKAEGARMVVHEGDFDYVDDPTGFEATINRILGPSFPYFMAVGNHDVDSWRADCSNRKGCYARALGERLARLGIAPDDPELDDQMYAVTYRGLKLVFVGQEEPPAGDSLYAPFIREQLSADNHIWRICNWHKNQNTLQVGGKDDEMGWEVYETCREQGAIVATAHEHSFHRTKTLVDVQSRTVDPAWPDRDRLRVGPGASFVFVSGLGGHSIRNQQRCRPTNYPYGCRQEWARIYTSDQGARFGALFITFNVDGDPYRARGYFKNVMGQIVDEFSVVSFNR